MLEDKLAVAKDAAWLYEKFGEGVYQDVPGLCKIESRDVILREKGASLTRALMSGLRRSRTTAWISKREWRKFIGNC